MNSSSTCRGHADIRRRNVAPRHRRRHVRDHLGLRHAETRQVGNRLGEALIFPEQLQRLSLKNRHAVRTRDLTSTQKRKKTGDTHQGLLPQNSKLASEHGCTPCPSLRRRGTAARSRRQAEARRAVVALRFPQPCSRPPQLPLMIGHEAVMRVRACRGAH